MIDSDSLTPDFLSCIVKKCQNLTHLVVSDKNIDRIHQYSVGSYGSEYNQMITLKIVQTVQASKI